MAKQCYGPVAAPGNGCGDMAMAPPDGSDPHDVAFRVYLYGSGFSTLFLGFAVLLDVILLYQLNMMDDEMLQHFIVWMGRFRLRFLLQRACPMFYKCSLSSAF